MKLEICVKMVKTFVAFGVLLIGFTGQSAFAEDFELKLQWSSAGPIPGRHAFNGLKPRILTHGSIIIFVPIRIINSNGVLQGHIKAQTA